MTCAHCQDLQERILQLETQLYNRDWEAPLEFHLTPMEASMVATMLTRDRACERDFLINATRKFGTSKQDPISNLMDTKICHIRAKLKPFGLEIITCWGVGWRITGESRDRLLSWNKRRAA